MVFVVGEFVSIDPRQWYLPGEYVERPATVYTLRILCRPRKYCIKFTYLTTDPLEVHGCSKTVLEDLKRSE